MSEGINQLDTNEPRWFAIYVHYKRERIVSKLLEGKGIEHYLALRKKTKKYASKIKTSQVPLIPCYLFVKITKKDYIPVLSSEYVYKFIKIKSDLLAIPEEQIDLLKQFCNPNVEVDSVTDSLEKGDEVMITGGDLLGVKGMLVQIENKNKVVVEMKNIGMEFLLTVDSRLIKKI